MGQQLPTTLTHFPYIHEKKKKQTNISPFCDESKRESKKFINKQNKRKTKPSHTLSAHLPVSANIKDNGQALVGLDASQGSVEGQLTHRDAHALHSKVTQAQDPLSVGHHDGSHVTLRPGKGRRLLKEKGEGGEARDYYLFIYCHYNNEFSYAVHSASRFYVGI